MRVTEYRPETKEEREARWWDAWWAADYSWDGLAKKEIVGRGQWGEQTLQDYWRRDPETGKGRNNAAIKRAGELIEFDGRWWHVVHLPLRSRDGGTETWKVKATADDWVAVEAAVGKRILTATETPGRFEDARSASGFVYVIDAIDARARLDGACLRDANGGLRPTPQGEHPTLHVSLDQAFLSDHFELAWPSLGPGASFISAAFIGDASFDGAVFAGDTGFHGATFFGDVGFDRAVFSEEVDFDNATFFGKARFGGATFSKDAGFMGATFMQDARFFSAIFYGYASFYGATVSGYAGFYSASFAADATFDSATFFGDVGFDQTTFDGNSRFHSVIFSLDADFDGAHFKKSLGISGEFRANAWFHNAVFAGPVTFAAGIDKPELGFAGAFYGARFADIADFSKSGPERLGDPSRNDGARMAIAFAEALFEKTLILTDGSEALAHRAIREGSFATILAQEPDRREELLDRLEAGCRTVKIAMGKARDEAREQRYYRFQLQARHARADTHWSEKFFGRLYGLVSDYGASLGRPLACVVGLTVACGLVYWLWASGLRGDTAFTPFSAEAWGRVASAVSFSFGRSLFLSAWLGVPEKDTTTWQWIFLHGSGPGWGLLIRAVAALQSILSGVLIFLFALAVRRRFQIGG